MLRAENVTKCFGKFKALDGLNINVKKGSVYGLVGPNGAGKTTFIKTLMGIYRQDSGSILVDGEPVYENNKIKQKIAYISDDLFFYTTYSIRDMAKFYSGIYKNWDWELFNKLSQVFNIDTKRTCIRLSKGMQKQVAFWLGICTRPELMVLDEPVDGLDPVMRKKTWAILMQEIEQREMTVLVSSHNLRELEDVCDCVGIMHEGRLLLEKSLDDVKGETHKLQLAFKAEPPKELNLTVMHKSQFGSVYTYIVKGEQDEILAACRELNPIICDILPLTLEEVFLYELGDKGYTIDGIII